MRHRQWLVANICFEFRHKLNGVRTCGHHFSEIKFPANTWQIQGHFFSVP
jgi:hypothetical protein